MSAHADDHPQGARPPTLPASDAAAARAAASRPAPDPAPQRGSSGERLAVRVPGYKLEGVVGRGGMGIVYRARQLSIDRVVAVKILPVKASRRPKFVERFLTEAKALARLNHPNVVQAIDAGQAGELVYFVMEFIDGETAGQRVEREGALPLKDVVHILLGAGRALEHAFKHGLVHRDVKPDNLMLAADGRVLLCDLGLARLGATLNQEGPSERTDIAEGTPAYIAPEQARGFADVDIRADLYSLGATAYHLLTGELPFDGEDGAEIMRKHVYSPFPELARRRKDAPRELCDLIARLTEKEPADRPDDPGEVVRELARLHTRLSRSGAQARGRRERAGDGASSDDDGGPASTAARTTASRDAVDWAIAGAAVLGALLVYWVLFRGPLRPPGSEPGGSEAPAGQRAAAAQRGNVAAGSVAEAGAQGGGAGRLGDGASAADAARAAEAAVRLAPLFEEARVGLAGPRRAEVLRDLGALAELYAGTPAAAEAVRVAAALAREAEAALEARLAQMRRRLGDLLAAGRFGQAREEVFALGPLADRVEGGAARLDAEVAAIEAACLRALVEAERAARELAAARRFDLAVDRLRRFRDQATPAARARVSRTLEELEAKAREEGREVGAAPPDATSGAPGGSEGEGAATEPGLAGGGPAGGPPGSGSGPDAGSPLAPGSPTAPPGAGADLAARALALFEEAQALVAAGKPDEALGRLGALAREHRGSPWLGARRPDLRALFVEARVPGLARGPKQAFFAGKVEERKGGQVRILYASSDAGGLADWIPATAAAGDGLERSRLRAGADAAWEIDGRVVWRGALAGEGSLEVALAEGTEARGFALLLRDAGHLRGLAGAIALAGPDEVLALAPRGPLRGSLPPGATFKLPGHVLLVPRGPELEEAEFLAFSKGPALPAGAARVALVEEAGKVRLVLGTAGLLEAPVPPEGPSGEGVALYAKEALRLTAIAVTGTLSPRWLEAEARSRASTEAAKLFP